MSLAGRTIWVQLPGGRVVACDADSVIATYAQDTSYHGWEVVDPPGEKPEQKEEAE
jgi:hypothetical protein